LNRKSSKGLRRSQKRGEEIRSQRFRERKWRNWKKNTENNLRRRMRFLIQMSMSVEIRHHWSFKRIFEGKRLQRLSNENVRSKTAFI